LRAALTGPAHDASTLAAVRLRLAQVLDHFVLEQRQPDVAIGPQPASAGGYWLRPVLRSDAFDSLLVTTGEPAAPRRSTSELFGVIRPTPR
jgi:hypothetical protein